ncbi:hypothetical protein KIL84_010311 [Mauremys mutica]|uniref:Uncharacterized protein n=1 Tax=Mauremys mutica TaxID=74926 RepID=A0A9D4B0S5_9SAUR|nr:hypothetical protein KIL84_010311 [Mauremys mutica]
MRYKARANLPNIRVLTTKVLAEVFQHLEAAMSLFEEHDPNIERSVSVNRGISNMYSCYREIYKEKRRTSVQTSLDALRLQRRLQRSPQPRALQKVLENQSIYDFICLFECCLPNKHIDVATLVIYN